MGTRNGPNLREFPHWDRLATQSGTCHTVRPYNLKLESRGPLKARQDRAGGIKYRPAAELTLDQPIDGRLGRRSAADNRHQPPGRLELVEQCWRNQSRPRRRERSRRRARLPASHSPEAPRQPSRSPAPTLARFWRAWRTRSGSSSSATTRSASWPITAAEYPVPVPTSST